MFCLLLSAVVGCSFGMVAREAASAVDSKWGWKRGCGRTLGEKGGIYESWCRGVCEAAMQQERV